jgi:hypothetical protein
MEVAKTKQYTREKFQEKSTIPTGKGGVETSHAFQWMLFKPQAHAVAPFEFNQPSRNDNTQRK